MSAVPTAPATPAALCAKQAAGILGVDQHTVYKWCGRGLLGRKEGGQWVISASELAIFRTSRTGDFGSLARFAGREADKLHTALRALFSYAEHVHAAMGRIGEFPAVDAARGEAIARLQATGALSREEADGLRAAGAKAA